MDLIIYGSGKMAQYVSYCFQNDSDYKVSAFCVDKQYLNDGDNKLLGIPILSMEDICLKYHPRNCFFHVAIGRNSARKSIAAKVSAAGYGFANYIASKANVWPDLCVGENVFIDQGCNIHPFVRIGSNVMLIGARIGHHCRVADNVLLSMNNLGDNVTIGEGSFLGINSAVREDVIIGAENIIGAGVIINKDTSDYTMVSLPKHHFRTGSSARFLLFSNANRSH